MICCITGKADNINGKFMKNVTNKVQVGSRGGARTTVERSTIIFLLYTVPLAEQYSRTLLNFDVNEDDW